MHGFLYEQEVCAIGKMEGFMRGRTDFAAALRVALGVYDRTPPQYECRILFFTDGAARVSTAELQRLQAAGIRVDVVGSVAGR
jgi:uncharacterized protein with von Willebrand factor type A (vWA) domain